MTTITVDPKHSAPRRKIKCEVFFALAANPERGQAILCVVVGCQSLSSGRLDTAEAKLGSAAGEKMLCKHLDTAAVPAIQASSHYSSVFTHKYPFICATLFEEKIYERKGPFVCC